MMRLCSQVWPSFWWPNRLAARKDLACVKARLDEPVGWRKFQLLASRQLARLTAVSDEPVKLSSAGAQEISL